MYNFKMVRSLVFLLAGKENVTLWMCCGSRGYLNYFHMIINLLIVIPFIAYFNAGYGLAIAMTQIFNQVSYICFWQARWRVSADLHARIVCKYSSV